jgi:alkanesulfonate monooxygenase SsuD/methylene tetrahydromethanopterin reductase-like flavin-dependent oxidoreductase (luciferase family)
VIERTRDPITQLGMQIPSLTYPDVPTEGLFERIAEMARTAEAGFDSVSVMDHFYQIRKVGMPTEPMRTHSWAVSPPEPPRHVWARWSPA